MNIGFAIQIMRKSKGMSQLDLAEICGISQAALSQIESGAKKPGNKTLDKICSELGTTKGLLYVMSITDEDVPNNKKEMYSELFPAIKKSILSMIQS